MNLGGAKQALKNSLTIMILSDCNFSQILIKISLHNVEEYIWFSCYSSMDEVLVYDILKTHETVKVTTSKSNYQNILTQFTKFIFFNIAQLFNYASFRTLIFSQHQLIQSISFLIKSIRLQFECTWKKLTLIFGESHSKIGELSHALWHVTIITNLQIVITPKLISPENMPHNKFSHVQGVLSFDWRTLKQR